ncbi:MAG: hypothetical protein ABIB11_06260 [Candidatus Omnitrophota bacterium]
MLKGAFRIILVLVLLAVSVAGVSLFFLRESERAKRVVVEERLWNEKVLKKKSERKLAKLNEKYNVLDKKRASLDKEAASLELEVSKAKGTANNIRNKLSDIAKQISLKNQEISAAEKSIASAKREVALVVEETWQMKKDIAELEKQRDSLLQEFLTYSKPPVDSKGNAPVKVEEELTVDQPKEPLLKGEILTINREFDFVVINLGKEDGIDEGMLLDVQRGEDSFGQVEVETVKDHISAAAIILGGDISKMRGGDSVLLF